MCCKETTGLEFSKSEIPVFILNNLFLIIDIFQVYYIISGLQRFHYTLWPFAHYISKVAPEISDLKAFYAQLMKWYFSVQRVLNVASCQHIFAL